MTLEERKHALERAFNKGVPNNDQYVRRVFDMYRDEIAEIDFIDCTLDYGKEDQALDIVLLLEYRIMLSINFDVETPDSQSVLFHVYDKKELLIADEMSLETIVQYITNVIKKLRELKEEDNGKNNQTDQAAD